MSGITDLIQTITLGTTVVVTIKRYGDGTISFTPVTAGTGEKRTQGDHPHQSWTVKLLAALATVA